MSAVRRTTASAPFGTVGYPPSPVVSLCFNSLEADLPSGDTGSEADGRKSNPGSHTASDPDGLPGNRRGFSIKDIQEASGTHRSRISRASRKGGASGPNRIRPPPGATLLAGVLNAARGASNRVLLTRLGGGAFGNADAWIDAALLRALRLVGEHDLDVVIVSYAPASLALNSFVRASGFAKSSSAKLPLHAHVQLPD